MWDWEKSSQFQSFNQMHTWSKQGFCGLGAGKTPLLLWKLYMDSKKEWSTQRSPFNFCTLLNSATLAAAPAVPHRSVLGLDEQSSTAALGWGNSAGHRAGRHDQPVQFHTASASTSGTCLHPTEMLRQGYCKAENGLKARAEEKWALFLLTLNWSIHSEDWEQCLNVCSWIPAQSLTF